MRTLDGLAVLDIEEWTIRTFRVAHSDVQSFGLALSRPDGVQVIYSGDALANELTHQPCANGAVCLIHDCGGRMDGNATHAGARSIARMMDGLDVKVIVLVHLPPMDSVEEDSIVEYLAGHVRGEVYAGKDDDCIIIETSGDVAVAHAEH